MIIEFKPHHLTVARVARDLSQTQLGDKVGVTSKQISKFETGMLFPKMQHFCKICDVLQVTPNFLLGLSSFSELDNETQRSAKSDAKTRNT